MRGRGKEEGGKGEEELRRQLEGGDEEGGRRVDGSKSEEFLFISLKTVLMADFWGRKSEN